MKKKEKSWHTRSLVFLVMEMRQGCCFICKQKLPDVESVLSCCTDRVALQAQMHFKGKIYPRDNCGLKITQTAAVGPALPLQGRDGEEFPPVRAACFGVELKTWGHISRAEEERRTTPLAMLQLSIGPVSGNLKTFSYSYEKVCFTK